MYDKKDVVEFIKENDVKFIRLAFCDIFGNLKNISIMPSELKKAFGVGISFDASSVRGFGDETKSELFLMPDPATLSVLPWRPAHGRVVRFFCDILTPESEQYALDSRAILAKAVSTARAKDISCYFGTECEFYLFKTDSDGNPTDIPFDNGGYMDVAPEDKGENVRREICLTLEEMGLKPERSHHECGPGQNEIDFKYSDAITSADNVTTFKSVVKTISNRNGLNATFDPKPIADREGNGMHINISLRTATGGEISEETKKQFMAGIIKHVYDMTAFLNPRTDSYKRLGEFKAPKYITWSHQNRSQLIRIPSETGEYARIELRSPDCLANPYIAYALLIYAGLDGINTHLAPPLPTDINLYHTNKEDVSSIKKLPESFSEAVDTAKNSAFIRRYIDKRILNAYEERMKG